MKLTIIVLLAIAIIFVALITKSRNAKNGMVAKAKPVLTKNEQPTWWLINEVCPSMDLVPLAQVAFSAFLTTELKARNQIAQKRADFVICNKAFWPVAVIEIDDSSHKGKEDKDAERDLLITSAGLDVFRYKGTPARERLLSDLMSVRKRDMKMK